MLRAPLIMPARPGHRSPTRTAGARIDQRRRAGNGEYAPASAPGRAAAGRAASRWGRDRRGAQRGRHRRGRPPATAAMPPRGPDRIRPLPRRGVFGMAPAPMPPWAQAAGKRVGYRLIGADPPSFANCAKRSSSAVLRSPGAISPGCTLLPGHAAQEAHGAERNQRGMRPEVPWLTASGGPAPGPCGSR